jgi:hypothetical protein
MTPTYCHECGRANAPGAKRCIWCGLPIVDEGRPDRFEATRVEIGYLDGIERLDNPTPVSLSVSGDGIEVKEVLPGTRSNKIPAGSIIGATVVDASMMVEDKKRSSPWWQVFLRPIGLPTAGQRQAKRHDYILNIKYREGDEVRNAVFHREDSAGLAVVEGLARIISMLVKLQDKKD